MCVCVHHDSQHSLMHFAIRRKRRGLLRLLGQSATSTQVVRVRAMHQPEPGNESPVPDQHCKCTPCVFRTWRARCHSLDEEIHSTASRGKLASLADWLNAATAAVAPLTRSAEDKCQVNTSGLPISGTELELTGLHCIFSWDNRRHDQAMPWVRNAIATSATTRLKSKPSNGFALRIIFVARIGRSPGGLHQGRAKRPPTSKPCNAGHSSLFFRVLVLIEHSQHWILH